MGVIGPQEVQGMMDILDSVQRAERTGKAPPGSYQQQLDDFESQYEHSMDRTGTNPADGFTGRIDGGVTRAPWRGEYDMPGNFDRRQKMANSMAEDAAMRESMRYSRRRGEDEPEGSFALSKYPGSEMDIMRVEKGFGSWGPASTFMDPQERMALEEKSERWAKHQRELLGMNTEGADEFRSRREAERGLTGRDRMRYIMGR
jgi:hypothetical protein